MRKVICPLLFVLVFLFASCTNPEIPDDDNTGGGSSSTGGEGDNNGYNNPNSGIARVLTFSHNSGLYAQPFSLVLAAPAGSVIYYSTDGSDPLPANAAKEHVFVKNSPVTISVVNRNGQPNILATKENTLQMYAQEGDLWNEGDDIYKPSNYVPNDAQVPKATVIRAWANYPDGKESEIITKTYFIGNNLANYANHPILSLVSDPKNLVDENIGIMVRGPAGKYWANTDPEYADILKANGYNFQQKEMEWEREAYMELFAGSTGSRTVPVSTGVGIRVHGDTSAAQPQKSFNVYFREEYGIKNLQNYNLIPGAFKADRKTPIEKYKNFILRNGSEDIMHTKFRDVFNQDLLRDRNFDTQAGVPCIVYINGEYWGPYNLLEKYSDNLLEYRFGVKKENVIACKDMELAEGISGEEQLYYDMISFRKKDMSVDENYKDFCEVFDIDNFIDYLAAEIYIHNEDWPAANSRAWRTRNVEPGNPYGDTKWRWQMYDTDLSLGMESEGSLTGMENQDAFYSTFHGIRSDVAVCELFTALLKNNDFCRQFVNTIMDLYNVNFHPDNWLPKMDYYANMYKPLMNGYFERWGFPYDDEDGGWVFDTWVGFNKRYLTSIRTTMVNTYLPRYFGSGSGVNNIGVSASGLRTVTLSASGAPIKINTITPNLPWIGTYYAGIPIPVTANVPAGRTFDGWEVTGGVAAEPGNPKTTVTITGNAVITARYK